MKKRGYEIMSINILDAMKLDTFKNFKLIAGHGGLENRVNSVGILDYEFLTEVEEQIYKGQFLKEQFVISSLLFAKDNPERIFTAVKNLIADGVSGLAIKNIYYHNLPQNILDLANSNSFPIFIFDNNVFFEDIITEVMDRVRRTENYELMEKKILSILNENINSSTIRELSLEINSNFKENYFVIYLKEIKYLSNERLLSLLNRMKFYRNIKNDASVLKYKNGIMIITSYDKFDNNDIKDMALEFISHTSLNIKDYFIGISNFHTNLEEMNKGMNEAIFAAETSRMLDKNTSFYKDIGMYKLLFPYFKEHWLKSFYDEIISPIKEYDDKYNTEMFNTAVKYIENDGVYKAAADSLFIHENTVRYRINKIKEILHKEKQEGSFYEELSVAIRLHKLYEKL